MDEQNPEIVHPSGWIFLLRVILIVLFLFLALFGGAAFGYVVIGDQSVGEVWDLDTWRHVLDLVFAP